MLDQRPEFTVVIPLYNGERTNAETLACVLAQTYRDFEVIVVNDASKDGGPAVVRGFMAHDPRIRMVDQENRGLAGARNTGIRHALGRYIALLDADDLWTPRKLELHKAHLDAAPDVGVSFAPSLFIDDAGNSIGLAQSPRLTGIDAEHVFCRNPVGNGSAAVLRSAALGSVAFCIDAPEGKRLCWFDETFRQSEDIELWTRIAATTSWKFAGIAEPLTLYRVSSGGLSADVDKQFASWARFRDKLRGLAPGLVETAGRRAEAYQRRYLARRAAISGNGRQALALIWAGLRLHPAMLVEEPRRTLLTLAVGCACCLIPAPAFARLKRASLGAIARWRTPSALKAAPATA